MCSRKATTISSEIKYGVPVPGFHLNILWFRFLGPWSHLINLVARVTGPTLGSQVPDTALEVLGPTITDRILETIVQYWKVQFLFLRSLLLVLTKFSFWEEDLALGLILWIFDVFLIFSIFLKSSVLIKSSGNSWGNLHIPCLLIMITLRFTGGERKIWQNIRKSQNIMTMTINWSAILPC